MKKVTASGIFFLFAIITFAQIKTEPVDYVSILTGTLSKFELSTGNTYPAIARPWGMNFWMPQTGEMGNGWSYVYTADKIRGFKQTHQPSPWMNDYGQFSIMPVVDKPVFNQDKRASWFSHKSEVAKPYYYKVYLADSDITTEITPTDRAAIFRFTFPEKDNSYVVIDAFDRGSYIKIIPEQNKIIGYTTRNSGGVPDNFKNYFVIVFDKPFTYQATVGDSEIRKNELEAKENHTGAIIGFATKRGETVHARVASSFISPEQAELNLKELGSDSFDQVADKGRQVWNETLGRIEVKDDNIDNLRTFYSCFYRSVLFPRSFYEIDAKGEVVHYSPYNGEVLPGYMFTDTGFWDTFRCLFPFLNLVYPSMNEKMQEGLVNAYKESGFLPEWASPGHRNIMVGNNSASVVADAYLKGLRGYDIETLWEALKHGANNVHPKVSASGRLGYEYYNKLGYVPDDVRIGQSAARTLEYAYDDWTIYRLGKALGKPESETSIYKERAMNYKNLYNPKFKLMTGRNENGEFDKTFVAEDWSRAFCEGNSWHWSFCVFHDPQGLIDLMGGKKEFNTMMDSVFIVPGSKGMESRGMIHEMREMQVMDMGQYAHGNQPIQHMVYLYNYSGEPWKTQYWAREIMDKLYNPNPDGYCGDEDNGQTSAWYVFSALGFYPVCPGSDEYILGSPLFKSVTLNLENGKKVVIKADNNSKASRYISSMTVNGKTHSKNYLTHDTLLKGANINYKMATTPNITRGINAADYPYSFSNEK
ncbi:GH92 family glycosyl hydrolase [Dysgonomonas sp. UBA7710]|uniref:GH92 family glycosyl hydrolase n=1 Tax=Dysgonomonas sp. UBA7710 TaxID=1946428 RepID=UPI0039C8935B